MAIVGSAIEDARSDPGRIDPEHFLRERYRSSRRGRLNAYYTIKPLVPRRVQIVARRLYAQRPRSTFPAWPIEPLLVNHCQAQLRSALAEQRVDRVPLVHRWPDRRRFAVVVTHDVESPSGIARIPELLDLERAHGIVSSWNFVAESYTTPPQVFDLVRDAGCEVGLHGIRHDGMLFRSRASFDAGLPAIRRYMREWGAVGFRSPATHRNADWMEELGCLYDSSFPDTDPFEPQPGGCCSILPFLLGDVVELPITMPQDHTLWEILRRHDIDLWRLKGDWIAANGGLINVIVHPDWVSTPERHRLYARLLGYLAELVEHRAGWRALPREVASWWKARTLLHVAADGDTAHIVGDGEPGPWRARATVAWASERDGEIELDV